MGRVKTSPHFLSSKDMSSCILFFLWPEWVLSSLRQSFWPHLQADKHQPEQYWGWGLGVQRGQAVTCSFGKSASQLSSLWSTVVLWGILEEASKTEANGADRMDQSNSSVWRRTRRRRSRGRVQNSFLFLFSLLFALPYTGLRKRGQAISARAQTGLPRRRLEARPALLNLLATSPAKIHIPSPL